jgi:hypothetical protein
LSSSLFTALMGARARAGVRGVRAQCQRRSARLRRPPSHPPHAHPHSRPPPPAPPQRRRLPPPPHPPPRQPLPHPPWSPPLPQCSPPSDQCSHRLLSSIIPPRPPLPHPHCHRRLHSGAPPLPTLRPRCSPACPAPWYRRRRRRCRLRPASSCAVSPCASTSRYPRPAHPLAFLSHVAGGSLRIERLGFGMCRAHSFGVRV